MSYKVRVKHSKERGRNYRMLRDRINKGKKYSRRLRKKLKIGEYTVYMFAVNAVLDDEKLPTVDDQLDFLWRFIDFIEPLGMFCGGGFGHSKWNGNSWMGVDRRLGGKEEKSCTEEDRRLVAEWITKQPEFIGVPFVSRLFDANWHFEPEEWELAAQVGDNRVEDNCDQLD